MRRGHLVGALSIKAVAASGLLVVSSALVCAPSATAAIHPQVSSGPITLDGTPVNVTLTSPGQNGQFTFSGTSGQRVSAQVTHSTVGPDCPAVQISLVRPNSTAFGATANTCNATAFLDAQTLDATGTWTILVDALGSAKGHLTLQAYSVTDQSSTIVRNGVAVPVTITTPGQNARFTVSINAGQQASVYLSNATFGKTCGVASISLIRPNGTTLGAPADNCKKTAFLDSQTLDASGVWTVLVDPTGSHTGTAMLQAFNTNDVTGLTHADGSDFAIATATPGQNAMIHFSGHVNQDVSAQISGATFTECFTLSLVRPDGTAFGNKVNSCDATAFLDAQKLNVDGIWNVLVDPKGMSTGTATLQVEDASAATKPITLNGAPVNVDLVSGQVGKYTFDGTKGQQVSAVVSNSTINGCDAYTLSLVRPTGTTFASTSGCGADGFLDSQTLDKTGVWELVIDPLGTNSGTATLNGYTFADDNGDADLTGKAANLDFNKPGQNAEWSFIGKANQKISAYVTESTLNDCDFTLSLIRPNGTTLGGAVHSCSATAFLDTQTLDAAGKWTVRVDPEGTNVGAAALQIFEIEDTAMAFKPGPSLKTFTVTEPGENASYKFTGHSGDHRTVTITGSTYEGCPAAITVSLVRPNGSVLTTQSTCGATLTIANAAIDADGSWTLLVDPQGPATGTMIIRFT
jgi:hypothetical protein